MVKVITYGTYDMLHHGHIRLLERAKELGDFLIVGVTSDDFDKTRGKINVQQSLSERVEAIRATGIADQIIVEEYDGQKIDDIRSFNIDIFTVGSDWIGAFDYLKDYCKVIYLERTEGISSSELRAKKRNVKIGLIGDYESRILNKYYKEFSEVNGAEISGICTINNELYTELSGKVPLLTGNFDELLEVSEAVYIVSHPSGHYEQVKKALHAGKHVLCESPIALKEAECKELFAIAKDKHLILMDAIKTAYSTAYNRLLLLLKSGRIGRIISVDGVCTSLENIKVEDPLFQWTWNSICAWGPTAMLPIFQIFGTAYKEMKISSLYLDPSNQFDAFTKIDFYYEKMVASLKVGRGVKSEGELIVTGTKGYAYVPAPWWKTDYFEIRYENPADNKRYFYQLDGEGIRYELVAFLKSINTGEINTYINPDISEAVSKVMEEFYRGNGMEIRG